MDWVKVVEENMLKQLWINPHKIPTNSFVQKYFTIVCRGILGADNTSTIEQEKSRLETPEVVGSHEGSSGVVGGMVPTAVAGQRKRSQPQSRPKQMVKRNRRKFYLLRKWKNGRKMKSKTS